MSPRTVWQLAGGPASWSYADVFLKYGVGLIGPGDTGAWEAGREDVEFEGYYVRHFASEMEVGRGHPAEGHQHHHSDRDSRKSLSLSGSIR